MLGTPLQVSAVNSGAQRHNLQVRQSLGVCKRRSHQSLQAGCPSRFPAPKPRCSEHGFSFSLFLHPVPDQNMFHKCWLNTPLRGKVLQNGQREVQTSSDLLSAPGSVLGKGIHSSSGPVLPCVSMVLSLTLHSHIFPPLGLSITKIKAFTYPSPTCTALPFLSPLLCAGIHSWP